MKKAKVISFINYKGGVAKTTSTYHIGCCLADFQQKKVLLIDIDPQTNLTFLCASVENWKKQKSNTGTIATIYKRFLEKKRLILNTIFGKNRSLTGEVNVIQGLT